MLSIEVKESSVPGGVSFAVVNSEFGEMVNSMKQDGTLKAAMDDLRVKQAFHKKKVDEIEVALQALQSIASDGSHEYQTVVMHDKEFAQAGIADAAATLIKRAKRPLHIKEITEALQAGGYVFKTDSPQGSVAPVLYTASKAKKYGLVNKSKNTYSTEEVDKGKIQ
jgi:hypothetical protein